VNKLALFSHTHPVIFCIFRFLFLSFLLFSGGGVLAPHQTDNAAIRQGESNFP
jgi:hypothetical protein